MSNFNCPNCKAELERVGDKLQCNKCGQCWWDAWHLSEVVKVEKSGQALPE